MSSNHMIKVPAIKLYLSGEYAWMAIVFESEEAISTLIDALSLIRDGASSHMHIHTERHSSVEVVISTKKHYKSLFGPVEDEVISIEKLLKVVNELPKGQLNF